MDINWHSLLPNLKREPAATRDEIDQLLADLSRPIQADERRSILDAQRNPWPVSHGLHSSWTPIDPSAWPMPGASPTTSWLAFLAWSNGGLVTQGEMEFCFFGTLEVREFLLAYQFPEYMPQAIPLGLDGAGNFAVLDVREPAPHAEYPVLVASAGNLGFEDARCLAPSFELFCRRTESVESALD